MGKLFAKDELKFLGLFYLERFISHLVYFAPAFWIIFFNETLSLVQISILFSVLAISTFIFEIPTGAFADLFGRKTSTLFAYIMMGLLLPSFIFINNFYLLLILFSLWGLFGTFYSGAREAWTIDNLKYYKREELVKSYYLKEHSAMKLGTFLSGLLGASIAHNDVGNEFEDIMSYVSKLKPKFDCEFDNISILKVEDNLLKVHKTYSLK